MAYCSWWPCGGEARYVHLGPVDRDGGPRAMSIATRDKGC